MNMPFHRRVVIGSRFTFQGETYTKRALSIGEDDKGLANVFQYDYEVEADAMNPDPQAGFPKWEGFEERQRRWWGKGQRPMTPPAEDSGQ